MNGTSALIERWRLRAASGAGSEEQQLHCTIVADAMVEMAATADHHDAAWGRLLAMLETPGMRREGWLRAAVHMNLWALARSHSAADLAQSRAATAKLVALHGHSKIAGIQNELDSMLMPGQPTLPMTTAAMLALWSATAGPSLTDAEAASCRETAVWLLTAAGPANGASRYVRSGDELDALTSLDAAAWREYIEPVRANPWLPYADRLGMVAEGPVQQALVEAVEQCVNVLRKRHETDERRVIAEKISALIRSAGCTQREFAAHIGTSPSRLSTYVNGQVTPSAALFLRITRAAQTISAERVDRRMASRDLGAAWSQSA